MSTSETARGPSSVPELHVCTPDGRVFRFVKTFHVGREQDCEMRLQDSKVSRRHLEVSFHDGRWHIRDLSSANGVFVNGQRVRTAAVEGTLTASLGIDGPSLLFESDPQARPKKTPVAAAATIQTPGSETKLLASYEERYFGSGALQGQVGGRTMMIRKAFEKVQKKQKYRFMWVAGALALAALGAAGYAYYKHQQVKQQQALALAFFYDMKALDVAIANIEKSLAQSGDVRMKEQVRSLRERRAQTESTYDNYLKVLNLYDARLSEEERLILRVTRRFGECELAAPTDYMQEIKSYIQKWRSTTRYEGAIKTATEMGYTPRIADEFIKQNLPPHFFYLAMQESSFNALASGPPTRWGYAKGMWQFIPDTAGRYGLTIGPLVSVPKPDFRDDRHDWQKATVAAARYIKDIYSTDAQASGLLVMASYNWGEGHVIKLVRSLPENPAERNFWKLVERYKNRVPPETYNYVFNIVAAAVIGEDPRLFGFSFDNPLGFVETQGTHP
jgi:membrane-bound lytic murein transglycosylase D